MNDVKDYRKSELKNYVIIHILAFACIHDYFPTLRCGDKTEILLALVNLILPMSAIYVYIFILDAIVPSNLKSEICNACYGCKCALFPKFLKKFYHSIVLRYKSFINKLWIPFPEETVFDDIKNDRIIDKRFTTEEAKKKYKEELKQLEELDDSQSKQKSKSMWHRIYTKYEKEATVLITYRDYLLCRDLCVITLLIMISYLFFIMYLCCSKVPITIWKILCIFAFLFFEMFVAATATRVKQERLVWNVISTDIHH